MIRIRLRRVGKKRHASYRVVVVNQPAKRDGAFLEILGAYDPHASPPVATLDEGRTKEWLSKGAMPSEAAAKILRRAGITEGVPAVAARPSKPPPEAAPVAAAVTTEAVAKRTSKPAKEAAPDAAVIATEASGVEAEADVEAGAASEEPAATATDEE